MQAFYDLCLSLFPDEYLAVHKQFLLLSVRQASLTILVSSVPSSSWDNPCAMSKRVETKKR